MVSKNDSFSSRLTAPGGYDASLFDHGEYNRYQDTALRLFQADQHWRRMKKISRQQQFTQVMSAYIAQGYDVNQAHAGAVVWQQQQDRVEFNSPAAFWNRMKGYAVLAGAALTGIYCIIFMIWHAAT